MRCLRGAVGCLFWAFVANVVLQPAAFAGSNWPRFRGPDGSGHYDETSLPVRWGAGDVVWRTELEGQGHSSVSIWDSRLLVTTARQTDQDQVERSVVCLDRSDGRVLWCRVVSVGEPERVQKMNSFASATCATDGERVVAFFGRGGIHCFDMEGTPIWSHDLGSFPGPWGTAASPIIVDNLVIQNCDAEGEGCLIAFEKRTGRIAWKAKRENIPRGGWNTPIVIDAQASSGLRRELIVNGEYGVRGYDPASGSEHWFCQSFNGRGTPIPAFGHGLLFVISGKAGDVYAVRPGGEGEVTQTRMVWHTPRRGGRDISSPILLGNYLFVVNMAGVGTCYDAATGRQLWQERLGGNFSASPIAAAGLIYAQNEAGQTLVIKPGDTLEIVATNDLAAPDNEVFRGTVAPSRGQLFFRSDRAVYCVGKK